LERKEEEEEVLFMTLAFFPFHLDEFKTKKKSCSFWLFGPVNTHTHTHITHHGPVAG